MKHLQFQHRRKGESGQAIFELAIMLVGLVALILGIIYVCGLTLTNNRLLLESKRQAEVNARLSGAEPENNTLNEYGNWRYGRYSVTANRRAEIPFLAGDRLFAATGNSIDAVPGNFQSDSDSALNREYPYYWLSPRKLDLDRFDSDFATEGGNALDAADLVGSRATTNDPTGGWEGSDSRKRQQLREAFRQWFGVGITSRMLDDIPSNQVYMPRTPEKD